MSGAGGALPADLSALAVLALIVVWFTRWADRTDKGRTSDLTQSRAEADALQVRLDACRDENAEQRAQKHDALNRLAAAQQRVGLARKLARNCTCGAMTSLIVLIDLDEWNGHG